MSGTEKAAMLWMLFVLLPFLLEAVLRRCRRTKSEAKRKA